MLPLSWQSALAQLTFCSNLVRFELPLGYHDQVQLRCFLFRYSVGPEVIRWFLPHNEQGWAQQVMLQRLPDGTIEHTRDDISALIWMPAMADLIASGKVEEL